MIPEKRQYEWVRAYKNLVQFKDLVGDKLHIIKYEDLVTKHNTIIQICRFIGIDCINGIGSTLHNKSLFKWRKDKIFGFQLDKRVAAFATQFYKLDEMQNKKSKLWVVCRNMHTYTNRLLRYKAKIIALVRYLKQGKSRT